MRCASLHRKLGTHISKVKSLSMDSWSNEQVEVSGRSYPDAHGIATDSCQNMKRNGNTNSNRRYNPSNTKPQVPLDVDEVDAALEKYMRQKYDLQLFSGGARKLAVRHDTGGTGSTRSSDDVPPPLPPKPGKRFGFGLRSVSSALPLGRGSHISPPMSPDPSGGSTPPLRVNKQSRVFGATVGGNQSDAPESKLASLREMGFMDDKRNAHVLKGLNGNVERAVETLIRLGEGGGSKARSSIYMQTRNFSQPAPSSSQEPVGLSKMSPDSPGDSDAPRKPNSQANYGAPEVTRKASPNPFALEPTTRSDNPFDRLDTQTPNTAPLENRFAHMQISPPPSLPLFPNATGGYPVQQPQLPDTRGQYSMTPPVPPASNQQLAQNVIHNPFLRNLQEPQTTSTNPFQPAPNAYPNNFPPMFLPNNPSSLHQTQLASRQQSIDSISTAPPSMAYFQETQQPSNHQTPNQSTNPFVPQHLPYQNASGAYIAQSTSSYAAQFSKQNSESSLQQQQQQHSIPQPQPQLQAQQIPPYSQPQFAQSFDHTQISTFQSQRPGDHSYVHPLFSQPPGSLRLPKSSILALYNNNHPQQRHASIPNPQPSSSQAPIDPSLPPLPEVEAPQSAPKRSVTMPAMSFLGSKNPFQSAAPSQVSSPPADPEIGAGAGLAAAAGFTPLSGKAGIQTDQGHRNIVVTNGAAFATASATPQSLARPGLNQHMSRDSVLVSGNVNGRHSPDAWGSLSATFR